MRQSTIIFGSLLLAFVVYITLRGQLPSYLNLFTGKGANTNSKGSTATQNNSTDSKSSNNFFNSVNKLNHTLSSMGLI